jgi:hypothetical protein
VLGHHSRRRPGPFVFGGPNRRAYQRRYRRFAPFSDHVRCRPMLTGRSPRRCRSTFTSRSPRPHSLHRHGHGIGDLNGRGGCFTYRRARSRSLRASAHFGVQHTAETRSSERPARRRRSAVAQVFEREGRTFRVRCSSSSSPTEVTPPPFSRRSTATTDRTSASASGVLQLQLRRPRRAITAPVTTVVLVRAAVFRARAAGNEAPSSSSSSPRT